MAQHLVEICLSWGSLYANHPVLRTLVAFAHVGALVAGGGSAVATDRGILVAGRAEAGSRERQLETLRMAHRVVIISLVLVTVSGLLFLGADLETYLHSRTFWIKMGLVALLTINGTVLVTAERRARRHDVRAWNVLRLSAIASLTLWFLTTLAGVALQNI